jgi:hypothetical protein
MKAAICYLTWNRFEYCKKSLQSIVENTDRNSYELILWDNGSTDAGMIEWLKNMCEQNKWSYLFFKKNEGLTKAMNIQMEIMNKQNFDVFCHISNDIIVPKKWLDAVFKAIQIPKVGLVGLNLEEDYKFEKEQFDSFELEKIRENGNIGGAHFCIPKKTYDILSGFQHVDFGYGQQDANYSLEVKILPHNFGLYYLPINEYHGEDLSKTEKKYGEYQQKIETRLRQSGSDNLGGRKYRDKLRDLRKQFENKKITEEYFISHLKNKTIKKLDMSQLLETNIFPPPVGIIEEHDFEKWTQCAKENKNEI